MSVNGLSPRVRGNHFGESIGSIPACAGEPLTVQVACENDTSEVQVSGLSPRVRGNLILVGRMPTDTSETWVYPRVCGGTSRQDTSESALLQK